MKILKTADRGLTTAVDALLVATFAVMLGLAAVQVFLRFFFHTGIVWGDVAARHLVLWVGFFGAYLATRERRHFHIDAFLRVFPPRVRLWMAVVTDFFTLTVLGFLVRASWTFVTVAIDPHSVLFLGIPEKYVAWIVPGGLSLMMVQFLLRLIDGVAAAIRKTPAGGEA